MPTTPSTSSDDPAVAAADRVLMGDDAQASPESARVLYEAAAAAGSGLALERLAVMAAVGVARKADFGEALDLLAKAADLGHRPAQKQLVILSGRKDLATRTPRAPIWGKVRAEIDLDRLLASPRVLQQHLSPAVFTIEGFIPKALCRWIIERGRDGLAAGKVSHIETGVAQPDPMRTARAAAFRLTGMDVALALVQERLARMARLPLHQHEPPNLLHYEPGQEYRAHFDFINPGVPAFQQELAMLGQRVATCLVYLNGDFDGGETGFPKLGWKYRGKPGDALLFYNVTSKGQPDASTLHAGLPPTRGEKWLLSLWVRDRVQPIV